MSQETLYKKLTQTAKDFVLATSPKAAGTNEPEPERFMARLAPTFKMSWGHKFFVTTMPPLQGFVDGDAFCKHQAGMAKNLKTWSIEPTSICVDVSKRTAVVRADFFMVVPARDAVLNDIVFWITMDEAGEKVVEAIEFVDPVASAELGQRMQARM
ncbi:hypothetical protein KC367_g6038 [Hortaea werneckii]|uniref:SnoaL-like domain-containing protein n=1 Tax=Hortaea werneckii EXF-2000 TaxID=1157616 RepID=A0A1Z5SNQ2_HORWE|nr:hypothetical protein KC350_g6993 [Hortaea werneckii]OTA22472.1 hypothetical protein BTJ68_14202 [Hortaea werneckii EXF-2000]KAI6842319.1 hypothetical protein KC358_g4064 [Hortaea werneckii]KAI6934420.1 hypothetical protein KC348_g6510 [Hortaea werneckii]KAI6941167.1 hypothetical protein KC341_g3075 [Hortaea werneckii]